MSVYLDYNATAPVRPQVAEAMAEVLVTPSNPSSVHSFGRAAKKKLEDARMAISRSLSVWPTEIVFTASATEANAMALRGFPGRRVLVSDMEHSSVRSAAGAVAVPSDNNGVIDLPALYEALKGEPALVSVMLANNETGVIQPLREIAHMCKERGALLHCDGVQALGKIPVDMGLIDPDMMTLSAHKCGGPVGAAALVVRQKLGILPLLTGGGQELNRRSGTENLAAIVGFSKAIELADLSAMERLRGWLSPVEAEMKKAGARVFGEKAPRLPNTVCVSMPGVSHEVQLMDFDLNGFAVSAGSACSSGRIEPSHVLLAMGVAREEAACAIRVSGGWATTGDEVARFGQAWLKLAARLKKAG